MNKRLLIVGGVAVLIGWCVARSELQAKPQVTINADAINRRIQVQTALGSYTDMTNTITKAQSVPELRQAVLKLAEAVYALNQ